MRTIITGGTIARADGVFDADVLVDDGVILEIGDGLAKTATADIIADVSGCIVMPGGVDAHTHVNLTVGERKVTDGFLAGTLAAAWGGTTTIVEHPGFGPEGCDLQHQTDAYRNEADGQCVVDYALHGVFQHVDEAVLDRIHGLVAEGIATFKAYTTYGGKLDDEAMLRVLATLKQSGGLLTVHAENHAMTCFLKDRYQAGAPHDPMSHLRSRPAACEAEAVNRMLCLAATAEAPVYIVHLSTAAGLEHIQRARKAGQKDIVVETCPQYLVLTDECYAERDGLKYIMAPPPRKESDQKALWKGLADGSISIVATDHCAFSLEQKRDSSDVFHCPGGVAGVETRLPILYSEGVLRGRLTLPRFVEVTATAPARIMGLSNKGRLEPGADADITVIDPNEERLIKAEKLHQQTDSTPYEGMIVRGWPRHVWLRGERLIDTFAFCGPEQPQGLFVSRKRTSDFC